MKSARQYDENTIKDEYIKHLEIKINNITVSVILPMYNTEKYIEKCLDSLITQTLPNIEIILINDGSTDNSLRLATKYSGGRVIIINQTNQGVSAARNTGIKLARGNYLYFADSDDFLINDATLEEMYNLATATKSDIVQGNGVFWYSKDNFKSIKNMSIYTEKTMLPKDYLKLTLINNQMFTGPCFGLYKKDIIEANKITFCTNLVCGEDTKYVFECILKANKICIYKNEIFAYRQINTSATKSNSKAEERLNSIKILYSLMDEITTDQDIKPYIDEFRAKMLICAFYDAKEKYINIKTKLSILKKAKAASLKIRAIIFIINTQLFYKIEQLQREIRHKALGELK